jgi:hypothetical protein
MGGSLSVHGGRVSIHRSHGANLSDWVEKVQHNRDVGRAEAVRFYRSYPSVGPIMTFLKRRSIWESGIGTQGTGAGEIIALRGQQVKPRQNRLCWLSQKRAQKRSYIRCSKAREIEYTPMVKLTLMAWEICYRDLTNRVTTLFTSVRKEADRVGPA